jgi:hypothetical protein
MIMSFSEIIRAKPVGNEQGVGVAFGARVCLGAHRGRAESGLGEAVHKRAIG